MQHVLGPAARLLRSVRVDLNTMELPVSGRVLHVSHFTVRCFSFSAIVKAKEDRTSPPAGEAQLKPSQSVVGSEWVRGTDMQAGVTGQTNTHQDPLQDTSIGLYQRFKRTFKQYGKVMVPVHLVTSSVWFGSFYYAAMKGVNLVPFLEYVGLPERLLSVLRDSQGGYALTAYAMYKLATPLRYTATLGGTSLSVQYLRRHGYFSTPPPVKEYLQDKMEETRERLSEKMEETKERFSEKMEETKELISGRMEETKERFTERMEETKGKLAEKLQETKDKVAFQKKTE